MDNGWRLYFRRYKVGRFIDLTNKKFGRLLVIERSRNDKQGEPMWRCRCDCGSEITVRGAALLQGHTVSCGCYCNEIHTSHGGSETRLYHVWHSMKERCYTKTHKAYADYGGRGIAMCSEWLDFANFRKWAMDCGYNENAPQWACTLDRIDVNGGYFPQNCRWVDMSEQSKNKRNNIQIKYNGEIHTLSEWAKILEIGYQTLYARLTVYKLPVEKAFCRRCN